MATTFRQDITAALVTAIDAFITANPTLLRRSESARPASIVGDLPIAFIDGRPEDISFDSGIRERIMTPAVVVVSPLADNIETVQRHAVLTDALVDHFTTYAQLVVNTVWDRMHVEDEDYPVTSADGDVRHFYATRFTFNNVSIMEGRN